MTTSPQNGAELPCSVALHWKPSLLWLQLQAVSDQSSTEKPALAHQEKSKTRIFNAPSAFKKGRERRVEEADEEREKGAEVAHAVPENIASWLSE